MTAGPSLPQKVLAVDRALSDIPHAFGGALSLAYYAEPRATVDIDVNVFVPPQEPELAFEPLRRLGVDVTPDDVDRVIRDGQTRVFWGGTPLDMFFAYDDFHYAARAGVRRVEFADSTIPILSAEHLIVCKVIFDRPKDWVDIDAILDAGTSVDAAEILRWVTRVVGDEDHRFLRIVAILTG
jgi:hypothetical protein